MSTPEAQPTRSFWRRWLRRGAALSLLLILAGGGVLGYYGALASRFDMAEIGAPWHPDMLESGRAGTRSGGSPSRTLHAAAPTQALPTLPRVPLRYAGAVAYEDLSESFRLALLAREDRRFQDHHGVDPRGILRAAKRNLSAWAIKEGGSTITQQLTRHVYQLRGRSLHRKLLEAMVAMRVERHYTKEEILTHYANRIYYGDGHWGVAAAARAYFDKHPRDLNLSESAILAGMLRSPNRIGPTRNMAACQLHRDQVLRALVDLGWVTPDQAQEARDAPIGPGVGGGMAGPSPSDRE